MRPNPAMWCEECGAVRMITERGAVLCPNGHGRVLSNSGITAKQLRNAERDRQRAIWAESFPLATQKDERPAAFGVYEIVGRKGLWKFKIHDGRDTSRLKWMEEPTEVGPGEIVAGYDCKVFYFQRMED
jgi:hypothetical protein